MSDTIKANKGRVEDGRMGTSKKGRWALNGGNSNVWNANSQESGQKQGFTWQEKLLQIVNIGYIK